MQRRPSDPTRLGSASRDSRCRIGQNRIPLLRAARVRDVRSPLLVLGLDGASLDVIRELAAAGRLPTLGAWLRDGVAGPLASTLPPMSFPAWSSFLTGVGPGEHGLFDFTQKIEGAYRLRFVNASDRAGETIFSRVSRAGGTVLALGMPATWPPERVRGLLVPGFDAPVSVGSDAEACSDPALYREIEERAGPWMTADLAEGAHDAGWHERAAEILPRRVEKKTRFAIEALRTLRQRNAGRRPDVVCVVFAESDTVAHHFWRDHDSSSPRHDPLANALRRGALGAVYEALDAACGELAEAMGSEALRVVVSDHGSGGASRRIVHLNRHLEQAGLLRRRPRSGLPLDSLARLARDAALRVLPPGAAQAIFRRARAGAARIESAARFGGFDWSRTTAFSEEANTQPGVWLNLAGREARGSVAAQDRERALRDVIDVLGEWRLPGGEGCVVSRVRPREEVYAGPFVSRAPDLIVELADDAGYGLSLVPTPWGVGTSESLRTLDLAELGGGRGRGLGGVHRPDGILVAAGPGAQALASVRRIEALAPALLRSIGLDERPSRPSPPAPRGFTADEEAELAARLRGLGYLE